MSSRNHLLPNGLGRLCKQAPDMPVCTDEQEAQQIVAHHDHQYIPSAEAVPCTSDYFEQHVPSPEELMIRREEGEEEVELEFFDSLAADPFLASSTTKQSIPAQIILVSLSSPSITAKLVGSQIPETIILVEDEPPLQMPLVPMRLSEMDMPMINTVVQNVATKRSHDDDSGKRTEKFWNKIRNKITVRRARKMFRRR